jgi:hypothetical protein
MRRGITLAKDPEHGANKLEGDGGRRGGPPVRRGAVVLFLCRPEPLLSSDFQARLTVRQPEPQIPDGNLYKPLPLLILFHFYKGGKARYLPPTPR